MGTDVLSVLISGFIHQTLGQFIFQPVGPKMCELLCENKNCTATTFDRVQLVCHVHINISTSNFDSHKLDGKERKRKEEVNELSQFKCPPKRGIITKSNATYAKLLLKACKEGNLFVVKRMVCQGLVDINHRFGNRMTPVMIASKNNKTEIFDFLVYQRCDLWARNIQKSGVLHHACFGGAEDIVMKLLDYNYTNIDCITTTGVTPLMFAVKQGHKPVAVLLINRGANMYTRDACKNNILHFACIGGNTDMVKYVISRTGIDMESRNCLGRTPLTLAVHNGYIKVVYDLMRNNANVRTVDRNGHNVIHTACKAGKLTMVEYLVNFGELRGFERKKTNFGMTAMDIARREGHRNIVSFLHSLQRSRRPILGNF